MVFISRGHDAPPETSLHKALGGTVANFPLRFLLWAERLGKSGTTPQVSNKHHFMSNLNATSFCWPLGAVRTGGVFAVYHSHAAASMAQ